MGVPGQEDLPKTGLGEGIPQKPPFKFPGPEKGGPDAGYYGGISPKYNPGGAAKGKKGKDKGSVDDALGSGKYNPKEGRTEKKHKTEKEAKQAAKDLAKDLFATNVGMVKDGRARSAEFVAHGDNVYCAELTYGGGEKSYAWSWSVGRTSYFRYIGVGDLKTPRPDGDSTVDLRQDPQLILKLTRLADKQQKGDSFRPDEGVSDPVPIKGSKEASGPEGGAGSPAKGGELAAAGATKAEAKWRFTPFGAFNVRPRAMPEITRIGVDTRARVLLEIRSLARSWSGREGDYRRIE